MGIYIDSWYNPNYGMWNSWDTNKQFEANILPFELKFRLPKLRKGRLIFDRDKFGRIIHSKPPRPVL